MDFEPLLPALSFRIEPIPGKGVGAVTNIDIKRGTQILAEKPLLRLRYDTPAGFTSFTAFIAHQLRSMTKDQQRQFFELKNNFPKSDPFQGIVQTNAHPLGPDASESGIFLLCSRFNHSCVPNAMYSWNTNVDSELIYAIKDIPKDTEITVCYIGEKDWARPSTSRINFLQTNFGFTCRCTLCISPSCHPSSDLRRTAYLTFNRTLRETVVSMIDPSHALQLCRQILQLLHDEDLTDMLPHATYFLCFQICIMHGDYARASAFADLVCKTMITCQGIRADGLEETRALVENPGSHGSAGRTEMWKTEIGERMEGGEEGFEEWLWSRAG